MVQITLALSALVSLIAGIIILVWRRSINVVIGGWLIINGILGLLSGLSFV